MVAFKVMEILMMKAVLIPAGICYKQNVIDISVMMGRMIQMRKLSLHHYL
jgi:hypothetical protein